LRWRREIFFKITQKGAVVLFIFEDGALISTAVVYVIVAVFGVYFEGVFAWHGLILTKDKPLLKVDEWFDGFVLAVVNEISAGERLRKFFLDEPGPVSIFSVAPGLDFF